MTAPAPGRRPDGGRPDGGRPGGRPPRPRAELEVVERRAVSSHTVRIVAGGAGYAEFHDNEFTDKYVKLVVGEFVAGQPPVEPGQRPVTRTYTVRRTDPERRQLTIDFVVHGDDGIAAPWARSAQPGDRLVLSGAGGGYRPDPTCDAHLFLGDESALPAISASLEVLSSTARAVVLLESSDADQVLDVETSAQIELVVVHRSDPGARPDLLAQALRATSWPTGRVDIFAHGERESMKAVRAALAERRSDDDRVSLSGYWAAGRTEDRFQAEKREPIGQLGG